MDRTWHFFSLREFVYIVAKICHRGTLPGETPTFPVDRNLENRQKHQRRCSAWVGQADFRKLQLNNGNHSGNCQRLSVNKKFNRTFAIKFKKRAILPQFALILCQGRTWILRSSRSVAVPHFFGWQRWISQYVYPRRQIYTPEEATIGSLKLDWLL